MSEMYKDVFESALAIASAEWNGRLELTPLDERVSVHDVATWTGKKCLLHFRDDLSPTVMDRITQAFRVLFSCINEASPSRAVSALHRKSEFGLGEWQFSLRDETTGVAFDIFRGYDQCQITTVWGALAA